MKWTGLLLTGILCNLTSSAGSRVISTLVGSPQSCRNEADDIEVRYTVKNHFTNYTKTSVVVEIDKSPDLIFFLFKGQQTTNPADAVQQHSPDSLVPLPVTRRVLKPGDSLEWKRMATIITRDWEASSTVPHPGDYFLLPFPNIQQVGSVNLPPYEPTKEDLLPIRIPKPTRETPACKRPPQTRRR